MKHKLAWRKRTFSDGFRSNISFDLRRGDIVLATVTKTREDRWYWHTMNFHKYHNTHGAPLFDSNTAKAQCIDWITANET